MIGHHQLEKSLARSQNFFGIGYDFHARLDQADAGGGQNARAGVHNAQAADAYRCLTLQMAERGNVDAVHACGIEDRCAAGDADSLAVQCDVDEARRCGGGRHTMDEFQLAVLHHDVPQL